jgi:hypothetical protein
MAIRQTTLVYETQFIKHTDLHRKFRMVCMRLGALNYGQV